MVTVRKAKKGDVGELASLIEEVIDNTHYYNAVARKQEIARFSPSIIRQYLLSPDALVYVAEDKNNIVGFRIGTIYAGVYWSEWGGVKQASRKKGISKKLFLGIEEELKKLKVHKMWCDSRTSNKESVHSLKKAGFKKVGVLANHWWKHDFYIWEKTL